MRCHSLAITIYRPKREVKFSEMKGKREIVSFFIKNGTKQCLSQDLDFSQKRSYLICLGSYLQKRGVIHSQRKLRDKARKLRERVRSLYILHAQNTKIVASSTG